jgi:hypothetical protein
VIAGLFGDRIGLVGGHCYKVYSQLGMSVSVLPVQKIGHCTRIKQVLLFDLAQLAATEVNLVVAVNSIALDRKQQPSYDFSDLVGRLTWQGDAVATQSNTARLVAQVILSAP